MTRLSTVVTEAAERLGVLLTPRNLLRDETEKTTSLHGLIEVLLPTISGMEECVKCCDHCYIGRLRRKRRGGWLGQRVRQRRLDSRCIDWIV